MTDLGVLQEGRMRRNLREAQRRRARRRRRLAIAAAVAMLGIAALLVIMATNLSDQRQPVLGGAAPSAVRPAAHATGYALTPAPRSRQIAASFKDKNLRSGLVFDVRSGQVLWAKDPNVALPIASLTKMMTALLVVEHAKPADKVMITRQATNFSGSGVGLLPLGKRVSVMALLYGLMLPSGNDAAIALAQQVAGTQTRFIAMMNAKAQAIGLRCTHFTTVSGVLDAGNHSCAADLAVLAHAVLTQRLLARIVATRSVVLPFPIKGGKLYLYNNNPLLLARYPGADGVKTGYTVAAGPCLVAAARRGRRWFGVVLLHSVNPAAQAQKLLNEAFARTAGAAA